MDVIGNMLTTIRNGYLAKKKLVESPHSKTNENLAKKLAEIGFVEKISVSTKDKRKIINIWLKYKNGEGALIHLKRISKPGLRIYVQKKEIKPILRGLGFTILSTHKGIMTNKEAVKKGFGGEVICEVW